MIVNIVSFGQRKDPLQPFLSDYQKRIVRPWSLEFTDHATGRKGEREPATQVMANEAAKISGIYWALTVSGTQVTSLELSRWLDQASQRRELTLVIGGADGLSPEVEKRAERRLSLSRMTFPHRLARLVLVEQIYRAQCILRGSPYHK